MFGMRQTSVKCKVNRFTILEVEEYISKDSSCTYLFTLFQLCSLYQISRYQLRNIHRRRNHLWKNYRRCWKNMRILSDACGYRSWMSLALADVLYLYMLYFESWTSEYEHPKQYIILVDFQGKKLSSTCILNTSTW